MTKAPLASEEKGTRESKETQELVERKEQQVMSLDQKERVDCQELLDQKDFKVFVFVSEGFNCGDGSVVVRLFTYLKGGGKGCTGLGFSESGWTLS